LFVGQAGSLMPLSYRQSFIFSRLQPPRCDRRFRLSTLFEDEQAKPPVPPEDKAPVINSFITLQSKLSGIRLAAGAPISNRRRISFCKRCDRRFRLSTPPTVRTQIPPISLLQKHDDKKD
jgi:hypothetical protein